MNRTAVVLVSCSTLLAGPVPSGAESISLKAVADTTLIEVAPDNNMGGHPFFNAGTTLNAKRNRGLLRFDFSSIPRGSRIKSASLVLEVVGIPTDEPASANFRLHKLLRSWGEGEKQSLTMPGRGDSATEGEATWNHRFAQTTNTWATPGGAADIDYLSLVTAEQFIYPEINQYVFGPTSQMRMDVQAWLDDPAQNHGWLLKAEDETVHTTARRFASSEEPEYSPSLAVEFEPPPSLDISRVGNQVHLSFQPRTNEGYLVQKAAALDAGSWTTLTNISSSDQVQQITLTNQISGNAWFFRLRAVD